MAKSSFYSGRGVTPENPDVTPVEPNNINAIEDSKNAAALSEAAAEASKDAAAQSATDAAASAYDANGSKILAEQAANFAGAFTSINQTHADNAAASATAAAASETAAAASETAAATSETNAAASESAVATSATNAANSATAAATSATNAAASETAAATSATNAANSLASMNTQEANAAASATAAAASETAAATSATNAATSATNASASETAASASETAAAASETAAAASETAAAASETAAGTSETNAATSETNAASSATSASTSAATATTQASNAATSATQAATSASDAATSETNAAASETAAAASETAAATSATNASNSATAAATSATQSANSAASIGNAETNSAASATQAATSATNAASSATNAATSESNAATSAANAATSASDASSSASDAATSASTAQGSASTATSQASSAAAQAANAASSATSATASQAAASASAGAASSSASAAAASASSAQASKDAALAALDNFDDRYLGQKTSDPSTDNDGDALVSGALYFNTTDDIMKVYDGSAWVAAYASLSGTLTSANNLSDLSNASDARSNLGLAIGTDVQAFDSVLAATTASYTTAQSAKLAAIEPNATSDQTITAGAGLDGGGTGDVTLSHSNTSSVQNTSNASNTFIQNLSFDTYGHVTSVSNGSMSIGSGTLSISGSGKIQGGGTFGANQAGNTTITLTHAAGTGQSSVNNSGGTVIQDISLDSTGHIASIGSYNLDNRYYTETEANSLFVNAAGDSMSGQLVVDDGNANPLELKRTSQVGIEFNDTSVGSRYLGVNGGNLWFGSNLNHGTNNKVFHDGYHPNADKWTTARTLSLSGDASGSVSWDGSANATLSVTVANDSHTHDGRYYTESEADSRFANITGDTFTGHVNVTYNTNTTGSSAPAYGSANLELQTSNNYTPAISFHRGGHSAGVLYEYGGEIYSKAWITKGQDGKLLSSGNIGSYAWTSSNDGTGSGLDADLLDGYHLSTTRNSANTVPVRDGNGYLQLGWINTTSGATTSTINKIYASYDSYIRYITPATFRSQITDGYYLGATAKAADSNLLDGIDSSAFLRSNANDSFSGLVTSTNTTVGMSFNGALSWAVSSSDAAHQRADARDDATNYSRLHWYGVSDGGSTNYFRHAWYDGSAYINIDANSSNINFTRTTGTANLQVHGNKVWHAGNDGSGSGLDADLLDGYHASSASTASTIALRNGSGDIYQRYGHSQYMSMSHSTTTRSSDTVFYSSTDNYIRKNNSTGFRNSLGLGTGDSPTLAGLTLGAGVTLSESSDRADLLQISSNTASWGGLQIRNSSNEGRWSFMTDGNAAGIYDDENSHWHIYMTENGGPEFRYNGVTKVTIGNSWMEMAEHIDMNNYDIYGVDQIFHHGDTNTYMQFHASDQWRVVTGGVERLEVNNSQVTSAEPIHAPSFHGDGSQLTGIAAGAAGGVFYENDQNVTSNYTITNGKNAMSAGPITVNSGVTVTVGSGETWTVV